MDLFQCMKGHGMAATGQMAGAVEMQKGEER